jgi:nucleoside-diphosphate-sugar epimerase
MTRTPSVLVTGTSGYVGRLIAATLLEREPHLTVLAPVRAKHDHERLRALVESELATADAEARARMLARLVLLPLPPTAQFATELVPHLRRELAPYEVLDIVHSAGCLSYFNEAKLREGNEELTSLMLELARELAVRQFIYVSTAFASGYVRGRIPEALHAEPAADPNEYTKSKRRTERIVATSGVPYQIHRPSIVVGRSHDGLYSGKPYGAYQIWTGLCRFLCGSYRSEIHVVAPDVPLNFVHQDAVQAGFHAAFRSAPAGSILHLVSRRPTLPTTREYWHLWMEACGRPRAVYYYDQLEDLDREALDEPQRLLVDFAEANIEISTHDWQFETRGLDALRDAGLVYPDATRASMEVCLRWFLERNPRAQQFMSTFAAQREGILPVAVPVPRGIRRRRTITDVGLPVVEHAGDIAAAG